MKTTKKDDTVKVWQVDVSGVQHCWRETDSTDPMWSEVQTWFSEESPKRGDAYLASNGLFYRWM